MPDQPVLNRNGGITYIQIPAADAPKLADFYGRAFGWNIRINGAHVGFDDAAGHVSGAFEADRAISREPGVLPYVYVDAIDAAIARITENGGEIVREPYPEGGLWVATFRDPDGNVIGVWQMGDRQ